MHFKRLTSVALSATLALTLCPGLAFASSPSPSSSSGSANLAAGVAASAIAQDAPTLKPQAKMQEIYVVTKRTETFHYGSEEGQSTSSTYNYKYNKNGLLAKRSNPYGNPTKWSYKGGAISKIVTNDAKATFKIKNGKRVSGTCSKPNGISYQKAQEKYAYSGGKMTTCESTHYSTRSDGNHKEKVTFKFTYKKGLPVKKTISGGSTSTAINYKFDSHGNVTKRYWDSGSTVMKNSYNELGLLEKTTIQGWDYTMEYRKMKVSSALAKAIKAQQWTIINPDFSFGLYGIDML